MSGLEAFLERARGAGLLDSTGRFTLDVTRAGDLLGRLQLPEPRAYILKLVQWAVASGAQSIQAKVARRRVSLWHDGQPPDLHRLLQAWEQPLEAGPLGHLAVALNTVSVLKPSSLEVRSGGIRYQLLPFFEVSPISLEPGISVRVEGLPRRFLERSSLVARTARFHLEIAQRAAVLLADLSGLHPPEAGLIRHLCLRSHIPVFLNGRPILRPITSYAHPWSDPPGLDYIPTDPGSRFQRIRFLLAQSTTPGSLACPTVRLGDQKTDWVQVQPGEREAPLVTDPAALAPGPTLGITMRGRPALPGHANYYRHAVTVSRGGVLSWVRDGVVIEESRIPGIPVWLMADATDLDTDLSQFTLVRNEAYQERRDWLMHWIP